MGQFEEFFLEQLSQLGEYAGVFYPKSRARTMGDLDRRQVDGCATFYKTSKYVFILRVSHCRFKLVEKHLVEFQQIAMSKPDLRKTEDAFNRVMVKDNVAVVTCLEHKALGQRFVIANAHLHWDPAYKDVKLVQTAMLLEEVERLSRLWGAKISSKTSLPVIIAGDFNSLPDSGVFELLSQGSIPPNHSDLESYSYGDYTANGMSHPFSLKSAYSHIDTIDFTNFTPTFKGVIDYVWYTTSSMVICGMLSHLDRDYCKQCVGFPNAHHPSDHIPLVVSVKPKKG